MPLPDPMTWCYPAPVPPGSTATVIIFTWYHLESKVLQILTGLNNNFFFIYFDKGLEKCQIFIKLTEIGRCSEFLFKILLYPGKSFTLNLILRVFVGHCTSP